MRFIAEHKDRAEGGLRWGVESICGVLGEHGSPIAPSTYYEAAARPPSKRAMRDEDLGSTSPGSGRRTTTSTARARSGWRSTAKASRSHAAPWNG